MEQNIKSITIYTKETCPYCMMAKNLLAQKNAQNIVEIRVDLNSDELDNMIKRSGRKTVPQIFIGDIHVGGFDDLSALNRSGKLDELLNK